MKTTKYITKREIIATLRSYNPTQICRLYKRIFGSVPEETRNPFGGEIGFKCLDGFKVYEWAKEYATSRKMDRCLYHVLDRASHHWKYSFYDLKYAHSQHGTYDPLPRMKARLNFQEEQERGRDSYSKVAMMGHTWLYACSPVYGHSDYNKAPMLPIQGNERYCELLMKKYGTI